MKNEVEKSIYALHAVELIRQCYGSGPDSVDRIKDVIDMLIKGADEGGAFGGIAKNVAAAISKAYLNTSI